MKVVIIIVVTITVITVRMIIMITLNTISSGKLSTMTEPDSVRVVPI